MNKINISELGSTIGLKNEEIEELSANKKQENYLIQINLALLTEGEKEVLIGVKDGLKDQEIAECFISIYLSIYLSQPFELT